MDIVCYPPEHEGFGNQAIETVWARRSLVVLEYPVFKRFVSAHIPHFISLGDTEHLERIDAFGGLHRVAPARLEEAASAAAGILTDHARERGEVDENFASLRAFCGIDVVASTYERLYAALLQRSAGAARTAELQ
jgi:mannosylglucosylglycerate synthase